MNWISHLISGSTFFLPITVIPNLQFLAIKYQREILIDMMGANRLLSYYEFSSSKLITTTRCPTTKHQLSSRTFLRGKFLGPRTSLWKFSFRLLTCSLTLKSPSQRSWRLHPSSKHFQAWCLDEWFFCCASTPDPLRFVWWSFWINLSRFYRWIELSHRQNSIQRQWRWLLPGHKKRIRGLGRYFRVPKRRTTGLIVWPFSSFARRLRCFSVRRVSFWSIRPDKLDRMILFRVVWWYCSHGCVWVACVARIWKKI